MSEKDKPIGGTAEAGMVAIGRAAARPPTEAEIQAGILKTMSEVVRSPYNPNALRAPENVKVANAPQWGWAEERKIGPVVKPGSMAERVMSDLIDAALPPGGEKKDRK